MRRICVDIDNVVAQSDSVMREVIKEITAGDVLLSYEDVKNFNYWECTDKRGKSITKDVWIQVHDAFSTEDRIMSIQPLPGAVEALTELSQSYRIHFATSRLRAARSSTVKWLDKHGFPDHDLHFLRHGEKHAALGGFFASVEDDLNQAISFCSIKIPCNFVLAHPWNEAVPGNCAAKRVADWSEIRAELLQQSVG